jgi:phospholipid transport system substrate-binding protein
VKRLLTIFCAALMAAACGAVAAAEAGPDQLVKSVSDEVLALRKLAESKVLPHFDFRAMTQLAVGQHWRQASPEQQKRLEEAFRTLLVNTYTASLSVAASGKESVDVKPLDVKPADNDIVVRTVVRGANRPPIPVDYRMARTPNGWKVYDVIVENLSLVTNYRGSFASEIGRSGIDGLVKVLEAKNNELAKAG